MKEDQPGKSFLLFRGLEKNSCAISLSVGRFPDLLGTGAAMGHSPAGAVTKKGKTLKNK